MNICCFIHPTRTYLPCSGVGRHMNGVLLSLARRHKASVHLLFARQWLGSDGRLPESCPLRDLPFTTFGWPENAIERSWKLLSRPRMDRLVPSGTDWVYSPMETYIPVRSTPWAVTIHDVKAFETDLPWSNTAEHRRLRLKWSMWIRKCLRDSRVVFTVSQYSRDRMIALLGAPPDKIVVVGNGIDEEYFDSLAVPLATDESPSVLIVGGLRTQKGAAAVIATAQACLSRRMNIRFDVAGPNEPVWQQAATQTGLFRFHGWIDDRGLRDLTRKASVLLFLSEYEGFGIPAVEAMAAGVPPVVADRASLPEVTGTAGFVVDPSAPDSIAELLGGLIDGRVSYDREAGRSWARRFTWDRVADDVLDTLNAFL